MRTTLVALASLFTAGTSLAQGSLSVQGFGFPPGQLSTRAEAMGGAVGELDAGSALNPASIAGIGGASLYLQYDPEFRTVTGSGITSKTTTARFPVIGLIFPLTSRWALGVGASTLVDRSSLTRVNRTRKIDTSSVMVDETTRVLGAIDDLRLALGWWASPAFRLGIAGHIISGTNNLTLIERFPDSAKFANLNEQSRLSYSGAAVSAGMEWRPSKVIGLGLSARKGGTMRAESGDTLLASAHAPDRYGASLEYTGLGDASVAVRIGRDRWSSMRSLTTSGVTSYDAWDIGAGAEGAGPHFLSRVMTLRVGIRTRTLPFSTTGSSVREISFGGGLGWELARNRANLDVGLQRASRSSGSAVREHAYILSFGLRVAP